ncbi:hypothetical protein CDAR_59331 [Caerostris darwini]|uniref:Uncharacterized protein n=1 Tax=Caerostris darwini TaxID=1538125 RepID=A0AAV4X208_9ARAC|nr:hypothetical protein CDAR_59331 [Caerostris darwini]
MKILVARRKTKIEVSEFDQLFGTKEFPKSHRFKQSHHSIFYCPLPPSSAMTYVQRKVCRSSHNHNQCIVSRKPEEKKRLKCRNSTNLLEQKNFQRAIALSRVTTVSSPRPLCYDVCPTRSLSFLP